MNTGWAPGEYVESAVRDVLTAGDSHVDATIGFSALLLASAGAAEEADRLITHWREVTERPVTRLVADPVQARAWAMLLAARHGDRADWAATMTPLDLDAEERAHAAYLSRSDASVPADLLGDSTAAAIVAGLAGKLAGTTRTDAIRVAAAKVERTARDGDLTGARAALGAWAALAHARSRPDVPGLAACRHVAPLLVAGADPLGIGGWWAQRCAGDLIAALRSRYPAASPGRDWPELVAMVIRLRAGGAEIPTPAEPGTVTEAERRLGARLPRDYQDFLLTCDGLPAHEVFPRLLGATELMPTAAGGVVISEYSRHGVIALIEAESGWRAAEWDPDLGVTQHQSFRDLVEHHLDLLQRGS